jgi:hypothetical protein
LRKKLQKFYQHIDCSTCAAKSIDHCYSNFWDAYKALTHPPFGKYDHDSILLLPSYRQKLKQEVPLLWTIQRWSNQRESTLQDCFDHPDWDRFRVASDNNIDKYTDTVTEFIKRCIGDVVPTVTSKTYPNQKLWLDGSIRTKLKARTIEFNHGKVTGNTVEYSVVIPSLRQSNRQNVGIETKSQFNGTDTRRMWHGRQTITDYKGKPATLRTPTSCFRTS